MLSGALLLQLIECSQAAWSVSEIVWLATRLVHDCNHLHMPAQRLVCLMDGIWHWQGYDDWVGYGLCFILWWCSKSRQERIFSTNYSIDVESTKKSCQGSRKTAMHSLGLIWMPPLWNTEPNKSLVQTCKSIFGSSIVFHSKLLAHGKLSGSGSFGQSKASSQLQF